jgi:hypothetical protein
MRRRIVLLVTCLLLVGGTSAGAATIGFQPRTHNDHIGASGARERCPGQVVAANRYWTVTYKFESVYTYLNACDRRRPRQPQLSISAADVAGPAVALRGPLIAFSDTFYDTTVGSMVSVVNPNNPRASYRLLRAPANGNVSDIALQDERRLAWSGCRLKLPNRRDRNEPLCPGGVTKRVYVIDASLIPKDVRGPIVLDDAKELAAGRTIRSRSLNIDAARKIVAWREGNRMMRYRMH